MPIYRTGNSIYTPQQVAGTGGLTPALANTANARFGVERRDPYYDNWDSAQFTASASQITDTGSTDTKTVTHVGSTSVSSATLTSASLVYPTGIEAADEGILVSGYNPSVGGTPNTPTGWTVTDTFVYSTTYHVRLYRRTMDGTEDGTTLNFSWAAASKTSWALTVMRAAWGGFAWDGSASLTSSTANVPAVSLTPGEVAAFTAVWNERGSSTLSTPQDGEPAGTTLRTYAVGTGGGTTSVAVADDLTVDTDGSVGSGTWNRNTTNSGAVVMLTVGWYGVVGSEPETLPDLPTTGPVVDLVPPTVIAHRGGGGHLPEETLYAYDYYSAANGWLHVPWEADVQLLSDGTPVLWHNATIEYPNNSGTFVDISTLSQAQWDTILVEWPTGFTGPPDEPAAYLADLLDMVEPGRVLGLEPKNPAALAIIMDMVEARNLVPNIIIMSFDLSTCITAADNGYWAMYQVYSATDLSVLTANRISMLNVEEAGLTTQLVTDAHAAGFTVWTWLVNQASERDTYALTGVDGFISNHPYRLTSPTDANGVGSGSWSFAGTATGSRPAKGSASGTFTFAGAAVGKRTPKAAASGSWTFAGAAVGKRTPKSAASGTFAYVGTTSAATQHRGTASGSWSFTGAASGKRVAKSSATGSWVFTGVAVGKRPAKGSGLGAWAFVGSAAGDTPPNRGIAVGAFQFTGAASGLAPTVPPKTGSATGTFTFTGAASGQRTAKASAAGSWSFTGAATGKRTPKSSAAGGFTYVGAATGRTQHRGTATGSWSFTGAAAGKRTPKAAATGSWTFSGAASGKRTPKSSALGAWAFVGAATGDTPPNRAVAVGAFQFTGAAVGDAPVVPVNEGTASGTWSFTGAAVGKKTPKASATGTLTYSGAAVGKRTPKSSASGSFTYTGAATGKRTTRATASSTFTFTGAASGKRSPKGSGTGTLAYTGNAIGNAPTVGMSEGSALGSWSFTGAGTGKTAPKGSASGTVLYVGVASGDVPPNLGNASGTVAYTGTAVGRRQPRGSASSTFTFTSTAVSRKPSKGSASGSFSYTGTASTAAGRAGSASGTLTFSGVATGKKRPVSEAGANTAWGGSAGGSRPAGGLATGVLVYTGVALTSPSVRAGSATGLTIWTAEASGAAAMSGVTAGHLYVTLSGELAIRNSFVGHLWRDSWDAGLKREMSGELSARQLEAVL